MAAIGELHGSKGIRYYCPSFSRVLAVNGEDIRSQQQSQRVVRSKFGIGSLRKHGLTVGSSSGYEYGSASEITNDLKRSLKGAGRFFFKRFYGGETQNVSGDDSGADNSSTGSQSKRKLVSQTYYTSGKRRRIDVGHLAESQLAYRLPTFIAHSNNESGTEMLNSSMVSKDPFNWGSWRSVPNKGQKSATRQDYGTTFIRKTKKSNLSKTYEEDPVNYIKIIFKGDKSLPNYMHQIESDSKTASFSSPHSKINNTSSFRSRISGLTHKIKESLENNHSKPSLDDLIIVKERKITPLEKKRNEFYRHVGDVNKALLDFEKYTKSYSSLLKSQSDAKKAYLLKISHKGLIPDISDKEIATIQATFQKNDSELLSKGNNLEVFVRDLKTLKPGAWLNDTVIEFFMQKIEANDEHCVAFNSFFYTTLADRGYQGVRRWLKRKKKTIDNLDKIFVPVNLNRSHWALCLIDLNNKRIIYVDSLSNGPNATSFAILSDLQHFVWEASEHKYGKDFELVNTDCPQQPNGYDCGVFVCMNAFYLKNESELTYQPSDASRMRHYIAKLILSQDTK